jgi:hypothetical protein
MAPEPRQSFPDEVPAARGSGAVQPVRLKAVALPVEHGGWGLLGEPLLLGLLAAPSAPGAAIGLTAASAFLARHPLKLAIADWRQRRRTARTRAAERFALVYGGLALGGLAFAVAARASRGWWLPLAAAGPLAVVQFLDDVRSQGRRPLPELLGGLALGSIAASEMLAAGWSLTGSLSAWALVAAKSGGAILYVRARLRCDRGLPIGRAAVVVVHAAGVLAALGLAAAGLTPWLAAAGLGVLFARAAHGLSRFHQRARPQVVGVMELGYGLTFVVMTTAGYALGL